MKVSITLVSITVMLLISLSCAHVTAPTQPTIAPSPLPPTNTPESIVMPATTPTEASVEVATEVSVNLDAPYDENANPQKDITNALAKSEKDGKLILLDFGANWCPDCIVLTTLFEDPAVKPFLEENFRMVRIDVGYWDKNLDISGQYGNPIASGIPAVVVLAPNGEVIASTKDGALANARTATAQEILAYLEQWLALKP
ncbi:MAG TPA: thioredoxin family protein [Anaerolineales bacterium]|nr:thioredoxin family protein [Anaerolineales bacterium]